MSTTKIVKDLYILYSQKHKDYNRLVNETVELYKEIELKIKLFVETRIELENILQKLKENGEDIDFLINKKNDNTE